MWTRKPKVHREVNLQSMSHQTSQAGVGGSAVQFGRSRRTGGCRDHERRDRCFHQAEAEESLCRKPFSRNPHESRLITLGCTHPWSFCSNCKVYPTILGVLGPKAKASDFILSVMFATHCTSRCSRILPLFRNDQSHWITSRKTAIA